MDTPRYGTKIQLGHLQDTSNKIDVAGKTRVQEIVGILLYYARAVDNTLLWSLNSIGSTQASPTVRTNRKIKKVLNYCATYPDATITFWASDMVLHVESNASFQSEARGRSCGGGYFYLSDKLQDPTKPPAPNSPNQKITAQSTFFARYCVKSSQARPKPNWEQFSTMPRTHIPSAWHSSKWATHSHPPQI
mmetsp:Transcript_10590/g.16170  ORF Transcript_10590/g.16170 Transcript_10590/m.16170 type:complete len:191 (+) Transcript_10590:222-794(+)